MTARSKRCTSTRSTGEKQLEKLARLRRRATAAVSRRRSTRCATRRGRNSNLMPPILDAVRAYATVGEMCDALRDVWGEYEEVAII